MSVLIQGLLKKHEAFETDLEVHRERVQDIEDAGNKLIEKVNFNEFRIIYLFRFRILLFLFSLRILKCKLTLSFSLHRVTTNLSWLTTGLHPLR